MHVHHPLALIIGCLIAAPLVIPNQRLHHWRYAIALGALGLGVVTSWALHELGLITDQPQAIVEGGLAAGAFLVVAIRSFYEAKAARVSDTAECREHGQCPRPPMETGQYPTMVAEERESLLDQRSNRD